MRRISCLAVALLIIINTFCITAYANDFDPTLTYDSSNQSISISGVRNGAATKAVNVYIMPQKENKVTTSLINDGKVLFDSARVDNEGNFSFEIVLPDSFVSGEYKAKITCLGETVYRPFLFLNEKLAGPAVEKINDATQSNIHSVLFDNIEYFGADKDTYAVNSSYLDSKIIALRPDLGYSINSFIQTYMQSLAMAKIKSNELTVAQSFEAYSTYLEIGAYVSIAEPVRGELDALVKANDYSEGTFADYYNQQLALAEAKTSLSAYDMRDLVLQKAKYLGIKTDVYNSINNEYYQFQVFDELFSLRNSIKSAEDIVQSFNTLAAQKKKLADDAKDVGGGSAGGSSPSKNTGLSYSVIGPDKTADEVTNNQINPPSTEKELPDISGHWAENAIRELYGKGMINGRGDGNFHPADNITRAEFAAIASRMLNLQNNGNSFFTDVKSGDWFSDDVNKLAAAEIISGYNGSFMPNELITRQDMAVMIYSIARYKQLDLAIDTEISFDDEADIAGYAKDKIAALSSNQIIFGNDGKFLPKDNASRAEAATLIYRLLHLIG